MYECTNNKLVQIRNNFLQKVVKIYPKLKLSTGFPPFGQNEIPYQFLTFGHRIPHQFPTIFCGRIEHVPKFFLSAQGFTWV